MKWSRYNIIRDIDEEKSLVVNTQTSSVSVLKKNILSMAINSMPENVKKHNIKLGLIVDENINEYEKAIDNFLKINNDTEILNLVFSVTDTCNLGCSYCYNKDYNKVASIDLLKIEQHISTLSQQHSFKKVNVIYTGGEPTIYHKTILKIQNILLDFFDKVDSLLITNGTLLNEDMINNLYINGISNYQITLDGPSCIHDQVRQFKKTGEGSFEKITNNITKIFNIINKKVILRININLENYTYMHNLLDELEQLNLKESIIIDFCKIYNSEHYYGDLNYKIYDLYMLAIDRGFICANHWKNLLPFNRTCSYYHKNSFVIDCDNNIYRCPYSRDDINTNEDFSSKNALMLKSVNGKCSQCEFFPLCMGGCVYKKTTEKSAINCDYYMYKVSIDILVNDIKSNIK